MTTRDQDRTGGVPWLAGFVTWSGVAALISGGFAWLLVRTQIADERIVVPGAAPHMAGRAVKGPLTAYEQAESIKRVALDVTGGKTYGELDQADPAAETALHASLLRASLFTSILAFGLASIQTALGVVLIAVGAALRRLSHRS
jgi:hypothetical protein